MEITLEKLNDIKEIIETTEKTHTYQSGVIYTIYNDLYNRNDKPSTCGSCVKTRFKLIKKWYEDNKENYTEEEPETKDQEHQEEPVAKPTNKKGRKQT